MYSDSHPDKTVQEVVRRWLSVIEPLYGDDYTLSFIAAYRPDDPGNRHASHVFTNNADDNERILRILVAASLDSDEDAKVEDVAEDGSVTHN